MRTRFRIYFNKVFTLTAWLSVVILGLFLVAVLGPIIIKGSSAIVFDGTIEFRKMQRSLFNRGDFDLLDKEIQQTNTVRKEVYQLIEQFKLTHLGVNRTEMQDRVDQIYSDFSDNAKNTLTGSNYSTARSIARKVRNAIEDALQSMDKEQIKQSLDDALTFKDNEFLVNTAAVGFFDIAEKLLKINQALDYQKIEIYSNQLTEIKTFITELLGPAPGESLPLLAENQFGATRTDMAEKLLNRIFYYEIWEHTDGQTGVKKLMPRREILAGTQIEQLLDLLENKWQAMLLPRKTFYWQYFIDDSTPGHYFGGVGPEILGTLVLTVVSMLFAVPLGIISAAYLVECAGDNIIIRLIRMCINTLAGVPSIVFGLFGLAFFVLFLFPILGFESKPCILAASLTLSLLTLPVMIRASEEAIKSVPKTYKEASLGLGAGRFKTFVQVILPSAAPGILTGIILSLSRVAGETAPILFTGAVALGSIPNFSITNLNWLFQSTRALSYGSYDMAVGDRIAMSVPHNQFGMVLSLILLILVLNGISIILRTKIAKKLKGV